VFNFLGIPKVKVRVELATKLFGTCLDMCPEKERYMRQYQRQLTVFEILNSPVSLITFILVNAADRFYLLVVT